MTTPERIIYHAPVSPRSPMDPPVARLRYLAPVGGSGVARSRYLAPVLGTLTRPSAKDSAPTEQLAPTKPGAPGASKALKPKSTGKPKPVPKPGPKGGKPGKPGKGKRAASKEPPVVVLPALDAKAVAEAETFGRVGDDGSVFVVDAAGERQVGQVPDATGSEAMNIYVRRYLDLVGKVNLFEARLTATDLSVREMDQTLTKLSEEAAEPAAVGDLVGLRARIAALGEVAAARRAELDAARAAAKAEAAAKRTAIVEAAEKIAGGDPAKIQWRPAGDELRKLLDEWKDAQRNGPRIDRAVEDELWKRFSAARTTFDRGRRQFFAELDAKNAEARVAKEALVAEAEKLSTSTDWGATAAAYRELMNRWKAAGRASRKDDDALWAKFRAAQDAFFDARTASNAAVDAEFGANLAVKEKLIAEAEALLPIKDIKAAKTAMRSIQDRWEAAGKVPRSDMQRVEGRMRAVEQAVRDAEEAQWRRSNPETRARAEGAAAQLEAAIAALEVELATAEASGDQKAVKAATAALAARRSWLEQVLKAAADSGG